MITVTYGTSLVGTLQSNFKEGTNNQFRRKERTENGNKQKRNKGTNITNKWCKWKKTD